MFINNLPEFATTCRYIVYRLVDDKAYFWDAWNNEEAACKAAFEIGGYVYRNK